MFAITLILFLFATTFYGFHNRQFYYRCEMNIEALRFGKQYERLLIASLVHSDWIHFFFNAITLYSVANRSASSVSAAGCFGIFMFCILSGNALTWWLKKTELGYVSNGITAGVLGVLFSEITRNPNGEMSFFFLPFGIPQWVFAFLFLGYTLYYLQNKESGLNHSNHWGGAIAGMLCAVALTPSLVFTHPLFIACLLLPSVIFVYLLHAYPHKFIIGLGGDKRPDLTLDDKYNISKSSRQVKVDALLDKISKKGVAALSKEEKKILDSQ